MATHSGSCHCGAIKFEIVSDLKEQTSCDCSLCIKKNARMVRVHQDAFKLTEGEDVLHEYRWNTQVARHYFCGTCGIYTFHRKTAAPDYFGVNIFCLDAVDPETIPLRATDGKTMDVVAIGARSVWPGPRI